jgi:peptide/nickel transport system permease protein
VSAWGTVWRDPAGRWGLLLLLILVAGAVAGPLLLPNPRVMEDFDQPSLKPPSQAHLLGTDYQRRDVLSRLANGGRVSLAVAAGAVTLSVTLGALVGLLAGYAGGATDAILMRLMDAAIAIPRLFLLLIIVAVMDHVPLVVLVLAIGGTGWFGTSRLVRAEVLRLRTMDFVRAAEALGVRPWRIIRRHLLPNVAGPLAAATTLAVGDVILLEAGLSFLGLGVRLPTPSWGGMILEGKSYIFDAPLTSIAPGLAIVLAVLAVNLVGEALQRPAEGVAP